MLERVHHVGIAVANLEASRALYESTLQMKAGLHRVMPDQGVEIQFYELPGTRIELLAPVGDDSPLVGFLKDRGPGLHHVCYEVKDIRQALKDLLNAGLRAVDDEPRLGAEERLIAFLHPKSAGGVLIELQQA